jgi:two-component system LytT family response regulator
MIRTIIIDDESDARESLRMALERYCPDIELLTSCTTPEEGIQSIRELQPHLVFLDVQMPHLSGFDLLAEIGEIDFAVIFVTAYNHYAIKAIKFSALDYLLKPVDPDDLVHAVQKAKNLHLRKENNFRYQSVLSNVKNQQLKMDKLAIPDSEGIIFVETANIICCRADGNYTMLYLSGGKTILVSKPLKDFEAILSNYGFSRVHHAALINMKHIQKYVKSDGGYVLLSDNHHVDVSRRKKEAFLQQLNNI